MDFGQSLQQQSRMVMARMFVTRRAPDDITLFFSEFFVLERILASSAVDDSNCVL